MSLQALRFDNMDKVPASIPGFPLEFNPFHEMYRLVCRKSLAVAGHSSFVSHLALCFPETVALIEEMDFGVLHLEVGALKLESRNAIARRQWDVVRKHFAFASEVMEHADPELRDAIRVSYLGNLFYCEVSLNFAKARCMLPRNLAIALDAIERHYESLR